MTTISKPSSPFAARFWHRLGFFDHRKAHSRCARRPFAPARRFSARFGHTRGCPKLLQNRWHDAPHLSGSDEVTTPFPGTIVGLPKRASQHQLVHGRCHHHTPVLELLCRAYMHFRPEQVLLEEAIGMFVRKAPPVAVHDFFQRQRHDPNPDEPTLPRIASGPFRSSAQDPVGGQLHFPRLAEVQVLTLLNLDWLAVLIGALPAFIRLAPRLRAASLKQVAILTGGSSFPRHKGGCLAVELPIAFEAQEGTELKALTGHHKGARGVPAIRQHARASRQQASQVFQLPYRYRD